jgi:hypothetical protein
MAGKAITATIELERSGCLPGDIIPVKVTITHTKPIKSMNGLVVTLYRQGRIDSHQPPSQQSQKGKSAERVRHEEYYPKSKTGLGGLSFSSSRSSSVFRKDLSQSFAPVIVDPRTLWTVAKASIRVPPEAFPSICCIPRGFISFRYYVEVVVDLRGKLAGQERPLPPVGMVSVPSRYGVGLHNDGNDANGVLATWDGGVVNTDQIRREKGVVALSFEILVGSIDSARGRGRLAGQRRLESPQPSDTWQNPELSVPHHDGDQPAPYGEHQMTDSNHEYGYADHEDGYNGINDNYYYYRNPEQYPVSTGVPLPEVPNEEELGEKERLRLAEERLLPSMPPVAADEIGASSSQANHAASAPVLPNDPYYEQWCSNRSASWPLPIHPSPPIDTIVQASTQTPPSPLPPNDSNLQTQMAGPSLSPTDDKQELERQRLRQDASAPLEVLTDDEDNSVDTGEGPSAPNASVLAPSAPMLEDLDDYQSHRQIPIRERLPRYER